MFYEKRVSLAPSCDHHRAVAAVQKETNKPYPITIFLSNPQLWNWVHNFCTKFLFENVCRLETLVFETVSCLSSSSHLSKGKLAPMVLPLDRPWCPVFLGIGIDPQRIPGYPRRWPVTLGILSPQIRIIHINPNKLKHVFKTIFLSKCLSNGFTSLGILASKPCNLAVAELYNFLGYQPNWIGQRLGSWAESIKLWTVASVLSIPRGIQESWNSGLALLSAGLPVMETFPYPTCCALEFKPFRR